MAGVELVTLVPAQEHAVLRGGCERRGCRAVVGIAELAEELGRRDCRSRGGNRRGDAVCGRRAICLT